MKKGKDISISLDSVKGVLLQLFRFLNRSRAFLFFLSVALLYGFIIWRVNVLASAEPTADEQSSAKKFVSTPRIDENVVKKMYSLQDNSVRVQTLFEDARNNPFNE